jgi:uncharacterized protein (TIGR02246 family)
LNGRRRLKIIFAALLILWPLHALAGPAEDASAVIDHWAAAVSANDANAVAKLYTSDALLYGLTSFKLSAGSEAIREYFKTALERGNKVTIGERHMVVLADAAVMGVGFYQFDLIQNGIRVPRSARFTFVVVKRGADWLIAHQHSSALPPAPYQ